MKSFFLTVLLTLAILLGIFAILFAWLGGFEKVEVTEAERGPFAIVYQEHLGEYAGVGKIIPEVKKVLEERGVATERFFGIYFDDPRLVKKKDLRSRAGSVIALSNLSKPGTLPAPFKQMILEKKVYAVVEFPFKSQASMLMGLTRVYPALEAHSKKKGYPRAEVMEIYDNPEKMTSAKITYLMPVRK